MDNDWKFKHNKLELLDQFGTIESEQQPQKNISFVYSYNTRVGFNCEIGKFQFAGAYVGDKFLYRRKALWKAPGKKM